MLIDLPMAFDHHVLAGIDTVRNDDKKRVLELVHEGFIQDIGPMRT